MNNKESRPYLLNVWVTSKCNASCPHCFYIQQDKAAFSGHTNNEVSFENFKNLLNNLRTIKQVHLLGGEPLLANDLFKITKYCNKNNIVVQIVTNGIALDKNQQKILNSNVNNVHISLDACDEREYRRIRNLPKADYSELCKNIKILAEKSKEVLNKFSVGLSFLIHKDNYHLIPEMLELGIDLKADYIHFTHFHRMHINDKESSKDAKIRLNTKKIIDMVMSKNTYPCGIIFPTKYHYPDTSVKYCYSLYKAYNIDHLGNAAPCYHLRHNKKYGNVFHDTDIYKNKNTERFRLDFLRKYPLPECVDCAARFTEFLFEPDKKKWTRLNKFN